MQIEGYGMNTPPLGPARRPNPAPAPEPQSRIEDAAELSPQERLRQLLEQKRWMAEAAFADASPEPELGKHIDLRV